mgnify:CR=1 FL=1
MNLTSLSFMSSRLHYLYAKTLRVIPVSKISASSRIGMSKHDVVSPSQITNMKSNIRAKKFYMKFWVESRSYLKFSLVGYNKISSTCRRLVKLSSKLLFNSNTVGIPSNKEFGRLEIKLPYSKGSSLS